MASVREYAILYIRGTRTGGVVVGGGNAVLATGQHALDGPEHTGQLPLERISTDETDTTLVVRPDGTGGLELGPAGDSAMVPYFIDTGETFTVPEFKQALFSETISGPGLLVVEGMLIEVD